MFRASACSGNRLTSGRRERQALCDEMPHVGHQMLMAGPPTWLRHIKALHDGVQKVYR